MITNDIAVFVDLDNVAIGAVEAKVTFDINLLLEYLKEKTDGRVVLRRAYADWRQHRHAPKYLAAAGFQLESTVNFMDKNLADMKMVVDAMETLVDGHNFSIYVLVTGDRDFLPLVQCLRKRGKVVIGVGIRHTSSGALKKLCDEFICYEDIITERQVLKVDSNEDLLRETMKQLFDEQPRLAISVIKQKMEKLSRGAFSKSKEGRMSFKKFLQGYPKILYMEQQGTSWYAVPPNGQDTKKPDAPVEKKLPSRSKQPVVQKKEQPKLVKEAPPTPKKVEESVADDTPLHVHYCADLKKNRLRVVPASDRLPIIKDIVNTLKGKDPIAWRKVVQIVYDKHEDDALKVSKSKIGDVMRLLQLGEVLAINLDKGRMHTNAPVGLQLNGNRTIQEAVMRGDATYLQHIQQLNDDVDFDEAAMALYETTGRARYLKVLQQQYKETSFVQDAPGRGGF